MTDYLDGALPAAERKRFEAHMAACEGCDFVTGAILPVDGGFLARRESAGEAEPARRAGLWKTSTTTPALGAEVRRITVADGTGPRCARRGAGVASLP